MVEHFSVTMNLEVEVGPIEIYSWLVTHFNAALGGLPPSPLDRRLRSDSPYSSGNPQYHPGLPGQRALPGPGHNFIDPCMRSLERDLHISLIVMDGFAL